MWNLNFSIDGSDLVNSFNLGTQSSMNTEYFIVNDCTQGKVIEHFCAVFPGIGISVLSVDLVIEPINSCNLSKLNRMYLDSWFPLSNVIRSGCLTFKQSRSSKVSTE